MDSIDRIRLDHYRIPLPTALSDSIHGDIGHFGLTAARLRLCEGVGEQGYSHWARIPNAGKPCGIRFGGTFIVWGRGGLASFALATLNIGLAKPRTNPGVHQGGECRLGAAYAGGIDPRFTLDDPLRPDRWVP